MKDGTDIEAELTDADPEDIVEYIDPGPVAEETTVDLAQEAPVNEVTEEMLRNDEDNPDSWLHFNKGHNQIGHSPADRMTRENVDSIEEQWVIETDSERMETTPIVVPGDPPVMYFTHTNVVVQAVNARTGEQYWRYNHGGAPSDVNRGVAVWQDKLYFATANAEIVALDRHTGERQWLTSTLMEGQEQDRIATSEAPIVYDGKVYLGQSGESGLQWANVTAVDAESGDVVWQQRTCPKDEWVGDTWEFSSGSVWVSPTIDEETDSLIACVSNPIPMYNTAVRPGPNKHTNSIMAYDAQTGDVKWSYQIMPGEAWDADASKTPMIYDVEYDGRSRRIVRHDNKLGWTYYLDAESGKLLARTPPFARQGGEMFQDRLKYPPAGEGNETLLRPHEGTEWLGAAHSPETGLDYIDANNDGNMIWMDPDWEFGPSQTNADGGDHFAIPEGHPHYGDQSTEVVAMDPISEEIAWSYQHEDVPGTWGYIRLYQGGVTSTSGNVVFSGSAAGYLVALDAETGDRLWRQKLGERIIAGPAVWDDPEEGKQYVSVAAYDRIVTLAVDA